VNELNLAHWWRAPTTSHGRTPSAVPARGLHPIPSRVMATAHPLRVLGFPVTVNPGFWFGLLLIYVLNAHAPQFAIRLVVALALFTLLHELGHALAARRFGADAAISLNFLVGFAMYRATRPMTRWQRATIAAAGPVSEIVIGSAALYALGATPWSYQSVRHDMLRYAIWWAGPALGAINLIPLLPLDGGMIASTALDRVLPGRAHRVMQWWTGIASVAAFVLVITTERFRPWALTVGLFAALNLRDVFGSRQRPKAARPMTNLSSLAVSSEAEGWAHGRAGLFPPPTSPSPWLQAHLLLEHGRPEQARDLLVRSMQEPSGTWVSPLQAGATPDQLRRLLTLLPEPAPIEDAYAAWVLQGAMLHAGLLKQSAELGIRVFGRYRIPVVAHDVARALARLGLPDNAMDWLRAAYETDADVARLDADPDLASLRGRADYDDLRARVAARVTA